MEIGMAIKSQRKYGAQINLLKYQWYKKKNAKVSDLSLDYFSAHKKLRYINKEAAEINVKKQLSVINSYTWESS